MQLDKNLEVNMLLNLYGNMLNDKQKSVMVNYFYYDNSLSEIAIDMGISRQAVSDLINRVVKTLQKYESKLNLISKTNRINSIMNELSKQQLKEETVNGLNKIKDILEE